MSRSRIRKRWPVLCILVWVIMVSSGCAGFDPFRPPRPDTWDQTHRLDPPAGWQVTDRNVGPQQESTSLAGPDSRGCLVSSWSDRPRYLWPPAPQDVRVQGHRATYGVLDPTYALYPRGVIWQQPGDRWIGVSCDLGRTGILQMAERVRSAENPMSVPFSLKDLPDGVVLDQLIESRQGGRRMTALLEVRGLQVRGLAGRPVMEVSSGAGRWYERGPVENRTINGHRVEIRRATQSICFVTTSDPVCVIGPTDEPASDWAPQAREIALRTAEALTPVRDPADESSWLDPDQAFR